MKDKKIITYIKNGKSETKEMNLFNKKEIIKDLYSSAFIQNNTYEFYIINEDIDFLLLKNMTFKKEVKFLLPKKETLLVLENCTFKSGGINFINGNVALLYPNLDPRYYTNRITAYNLENLEIDIAKDDKSYISVYGKSNNLSINTKNKINNIFVTTNNCYLKNINSVQHLEIKGGNAILDKCNIGINLEAETYNIDIEKLILKNSSLLLHPNSSKENLQLGTLYLNNSNIYIDDSYFEEVKIKCNQLTLENSILEAREKLRLKCQRISIDDKSKLLSDDNISILNNTYSRKEDQNNLELTLEDLIKLQNKSYLISILKAVKEKLETSKEESKILKRKISN